MIRTLACYTCVVAMALFAAATARGQDAKLIEAAKKEGKVVTTKA